MVQHAGADDLIEDLYRARRRLRSRSRRRSQISEFVFSLKLAAVAETRFADVDPRHLRVRLAHRMDGGLGRAAAGDQDLAIRRRLARRPKEKRQRPAAIGIAIELAMPVKVAERRRIGMALVKGPHFARPDRRAVTRSLPPKPPASSLQEARAAAKWLPLGSLSPRPAQCMPAAVSCIAFNASSSVKVLGFWIGGKSLKVAAHCDAAACAP